MSSCFRFIGRIHPLHWLLLVSAVSGVQFDFHFPTSNRFTTLLHTFGLDRGARLYLNITDVDIEKDSQWHTDALYVSLLNEAQWAMLGVNDDPSESSQQQMEDSLKPLSSCTVQTCKHDDYLSSRPHQCCVGLSTLRIEFRGPVEVDHTVKELGLYTLLLTNCQGHAIDVQGHVAVMNPGGEHLSVERLSMVPVLVGLVWSYGVLIVCWAAACWKHRASLLGIHAVLGTGFAFKFVEILWSLLRFQQFSAYGSIMNPLESLEQVYTVITETTFLAVLLLTAMGWTILHQNLSRREKQLIGSAFSTYTCFGVLQRTCSHPTLCGAFLLSFYVAKFLITFGIIVAMNANIERLRSTHAAADTGPPNEPTITYMKLKMFQWFRVAFLIYLMLPVLMLFVEHSLFSWEQTWVSVLMQEGITLCVYVLINRTFSPRNEAVTLPIVAATQRLFRLHRMDE